LRCADILRRRPRTGRYWRVDGIGILYAHVADTRLTVSIRTKQRNQTVRLNVTSRAVLSRFRDSTSPTRPSAVGAFPRLPHCPKHQTGSAPCATLTLSVQSVSIGRTLVRARLEMDPRKSSDGSEMIRSDRNGSNVRFCTNGLKAGLVLREFCAAAAPLAARS
jgi:hypothetical protein